MSTTSSYQEVSSENPIDKILEQGQRLRNAIVQSILDHDPFNTDIFTDIATKNLVKSRLRKRISSSCSASRYEIDEKKKMNLFLRGDTMSRRDEIEALETLRSMSAEDLCKTTNLAYKFKPSECCCLTCLKYAEEGIDSTVKSTHKNCVSKEHRIDSHKDLCNPKLNEYLKYVDCLRVTVLDLTLNDQGNKKVNASLTSDKKVPVFGSQTFFIEYELPFILSVATHMKKKKSASTIKDNNFVRICTRRLSSEAIPFKQTSVHYVQNVDQINLEGIDLKFQVSCRTMKQKHVIPLGCGVFNFGRFLMSPTLSCIEEIPVKLNDHVPIVLGKLRVTVQMGCGGLYFGREFIASLEGTNASTSQITEDEEVNNTFHKLPCKKTCDKKERKKVPKVGGKESVSQLKIDQKEILIHKNKDEESKKETDDKWERGNSSLKNSKTQEKRILFGFLYIPEARYLRESINSFISCRPFYQDDECTSKFVKSESNPVFNFCQLIPLVYDDNLLKQLRENVLVIEFWEKFETKNLLYGVTKISLHQFYVAYRNQDVTRYLANNKLPIIAADWWEPINNPFTEELVGQVQVLLALGTEQQVHNLEQERGFKVDFVKRAFVEPIQNNKEQLKERKLVNKSSEDKVRFKNGLRSGQTIRKPTTEDKAIQSDLEMDQESKKETVAMETQTTNLVETGVNTDETNANKITCDETVDNDPRAQPISARALESQHSSFSSSKQYENAPPLVRSTSDLLNTLHAALTIPSPKRPLVSANRTHSQNIGDYATKHLRTSFKAQISINQAMHLPIRKKCKKSKSKVGKNDNNAKPSSYVTFETMPGLDLKMTPLVAKTTSPCWNYKCDVFLPSELLYNNQKRLLFKVWRKCTNTTMVPNLQSDLILGFAALDLTVLLTGFQTIQGWFNIVDFSSKCNGQINIHVTPLEDLSQFNAQKDIYTCSTSPSLTNDENNAARNPLPISKTAHSSQQDELNCEIDEPESELLSRALKRKFTELDEITQRLRLRLSHVTNDESDDGNDEVANEFERDINSLSIEEDYDLVNFDAENEKFEASNALWVGGDLGSSSTSSVGGASLSGRSNVSLMVVPNHEEVDKEFESTEESLSLLDKQLLEGKQRIDTLLGKLSLISGESNSFSSRYISGCSTSNRNDTRIDTEAILKDLDLHSRPNILANSRFDDDVFQQIYRGSEKSSSSVSSGTSVISNLAVLRTAPEGQGMSTEDKVKK